MIDRRRKIFRCGTGLEAFIFAVGCRAGNSGELVSHIAFARLDEDSEGICNQVSNWRRIPSKRGDIPSYRTRLNHSFFFCDTQFRSVSPTVDFCQPSPLVALTFGNNTVVKCDRPISMPQFSNLKRIGRLTGYIQALAIAFGSKENMVLGFRAHGLCEDRFEFNKGSTMDELRRSKILKPVLRTLDGIEFSFAIRGGLNQSRFCARSDEVANNV